MSSSPLILCRPLLLLPSIFPSIRVFSNKSVLHIRWSKSWSLSPSNEYTGPISFRIDWFDFLAVQGTQESSPKLQFKSINYLALSSLYGLLFMVGGKWYSLSQISCILRVWLFIKIGPNSHPKTKFFLFTQVLIRSLIKVLSLLFWIIWNIP